LATIEEADIRNKPKLYLILLLGLALLLASSTISCGQNPRYIYENGAVVVRGDGEPIELINNPNAINPTYAELVAFIKEDSTDEHPYTNGSFFPVSLLYVCSDFAEDVHNNAEAAGIRAAWVGIDFEGNDDGHALNAFETTDKGLVYIDCTGREFFPSLRKYNATSWDKVAYVEVGKEYGVIDIAKAKSPSYSFYEEYKQKWQEYEGMLSDYNEEVIQFNQEVNKYGKLLNEYNDEVAEYNNEYSEYKRCMALGGPWREAADASAIGFFIQYGRTFEAEREYLEKQGSALKEWREELRDCEAKLEEKGEIVNQLGEELGDFWFEPLGIVREAQIHW